MKYTLRPYQEEMATIAVNQLQKQDGRPFILQAATGAGKSLIIAEICHRLNAPVLILQPSKELVFQNHAKLKSYGIEDIGIYSASAGSKEIAKFTYATIGSIYRKPHLFAHFRYVIIDECDLVGAQGMYRTFLKAIDCKAVCGLTATPYRITQTYKRYGQTMVYTAVLKTLTRMKPKDAFWKHIAYKVETHQLQDQGFLVPIRYHTEADDLDRLVVNSTGADYTAASLEKWSVGRTDRIVALSEFVDDKAKRNLIFCSSVKQAEGALERMIERGLSVALVTADTPAKERDRVVKDFQGGVIKHLLNVGVFAVGFDAPALDCIIMARPTMSVRIWYQIIGRGVRVDPENPNKVLKVFDLAGNRTKLGSVESIRLGKEPDGFRDLVMSSAGRLDERPLYSYKVTVNRSKKSAGTKPEHTNPNAAPSFSAGR